MIPRAHITHWAGAAPWPTVAQVEQDLLLSRLICEIAQDPYLGEELIFRGGTCFHKLHLHPARRYSEDLDYVRKTRGGISELTQAASAIGERLGFTVKTKISMHPKVYFLTEADDGSRLRIKIEVNTRELSPADPVELRSYRVESPWWSGAAEVRTFTTRELAATKIRALFERNKGRDLFDMWLALTELGLSGDALLEAFEPYHSPSITAKSAVANLRAKLASPAFRSDLDPFVTALPTGYDVDQAAELVIAEVLEKITTPTTGSVTSRR